MFGSNAFYSGVGVGLNAFAGGPIWNYTMYSTQVSSTRLLYHSGLNLAVPYPLLPTKTTNFSRDILPRRDYVIDKTLTSKRLTQWDSIIDDIIIEETWEAPGGLAMPWAFFHDLHRMYITDVDWINGQYMTWRPLDRNGKVYAVEIVTIEVDGEDFDVRWTGLPPSLGYGALGVQDPTKTAAAAEIGHDIFSLSKLTIKYLLRPETAPGVTMFVTAGSGTVNESGVFEQE